jgi:hypothetical protein
MCDTQTYIVTVWQVQYSAISAYRIVLSECVDSNKIAIIQDEPNQTPNYVFTRRSWWSRDLRLGLRSLGAGIAGSNAAENMEVCVLSVFFCCQVQVSATDRSLVQRSPADYGLSEFNRETSQRRPSPTWAVEAWKESLNTNRKSARRYSYQL